MKPGMASATKDPELDSNPKSKGSPISPNSVANPTPLPQNTKTTKERGGLGCATSQDHSFCTSLEKGGVSSDGSSSTCCVCPQTQSGLSEGEPAVVGIQSSFAGT